MYLYKLIIEKSLLTLFYRFREYAKVALSLLAVSPGLLVFLKSKPQHDADLSGNFWVVL